LANILSVALLGIVHSLAHTIEGTGVNRDDFFGKIDKLAENADKDICTYNNPRTVTAADMKAVYTAALNGDWI